MVAGGYQAGTRRTYNSCRSLLLVMWGPTARAGEEATSAQCESCVAVGWLAQRGQDRRLDTSLPAMLAGTAVIYAVGVPLLAHDLGIDSTNAMEYGLTPFVVGDAVKLLLAGALVPAAWRFAARR